MSGVSNRTASGRANRRTVSNARGFMTPRAFVHIGTSKTGTTSIQRIMMQEAGRLRRDLSINYPDTRTNHMVLAMPFVGDAPFTPIDNHVLRGHSTRERLERRGRRLVDGLTRDAQRFETHVLSSEQLQVMDEGAVRRMKGFFDKIGLKTAIVVYVRHPAERLSSLISQRLRSGRFSLEDAAVYDDVFPMLQMYTRVFGREQVIVRPFDRRHWPNGRLIDDFTATVRGTPIEDMTELRENESLSAPAVQIAARLFEVAPLISRKRGHETWLTRIAGPKFRAPRRLVEQAMEASRDCLAYLASEYGIRFDEVDLSQFPETLSTDFPPETILSLAEIMNEQSFALDIKARRLEGKIAKAIGKVLPPRWRGVRTPAWAADGGASRSR